MDASEAAKQEEALRALLDPATLQLAQRLGALIAVRAAVEVMQRARPEWTAETRAAMREAAALTVLKAGTMTLRDESSPLISALLAVADLFHKDEHALGARTRESIVGHRAMIGDALATMKNEIGRDAVVVLAADRVAP